MAVLCVVLNKTLQERKWFWTARAWAGDPSPDQCQPGQVLAQEGEEAPATNRTPVCSLWVLAPRMWPDDELPLGWLLYSEYKTYDIGYSLQQPCGDLAAV